MRIVSSPCRAIRIIRAVHAVELGQSWQILTFTSTLGE